LSYGAMHVLMRSAALTASGGLMHDIMSRQVTGGMMA